VNHFAKTITSVSEMRELAQGDALWLDEEPNHHAMYGFLRSQFGNHLNVDSVSLRNVTTVPISYPYMYRL
jgi:hypothetical protein